MVDTPERIWLSAPDIDNEHDVWFDPSEGGTEYLRADIAALRAAVPEGEPVAYMHWNGAIWRADNYPAGMDFFKNGWIHLYTHPAPRPDMDRELAEAIEQRDYFKAEAEAGTEYIAAQREKIDLLGRELAEAQAKAREGFYAATTILPTGTVLNLDAGVLAYLSHVRLVDVEKPLTRMDSSALPLWHQIEELFAKFCLPSPSVRLRDELVTILSWARHGEALDAALSGAYIPAPDKAEARREDADFPTSVCTAWEDCKHDGVCHDPAQCAPDKAEARREARQFLPTEDGEFNGNCPVDDRVPIAATDGRDVDWVDVTGWGVFKGHAIPVDVARFIAEKINFYVAYRDDSAALIHQEPK